MLREFLKKFNINIIYLAFFVLSTGCFGIIYLRHSKSAKIYSVITRKKAKLENTKYKAFFVCNFEQMRSIENLKNVNDISTIFKDSEISFYYLFALKDTHDIYFDSIQSIAVRNNIEDKQIVYVDLEEKNNFLDKNSINAYPTLIIFNQKNKVIYKHVGWNDTANISREIDKIIKNA